MKKIDRKKLSVNIETIGNLSLASVRGGIHWSDDCSSVCTAGACSAACLRQTTVETEALCVG